MRNSYKEEYNNMSIAQQDSHNQYENHRVAIAAANERSPDGLEKRLLNLQKKGEELDKPQPVNGANKYIEDSLPDDEFWDSYAKDETADLLINSRSDVNKALGYINYWEQEKEQIRKTAQEEQTKLGRWTKRSMNKVDQKIAFHSVALQGYLRREKQKSIDVPNGRAYTRKAPEVYTTPNGTENPGDYMAFCEQYKDEPFVKTERKIDRNALKKYVKQTGHIPDGVDVSFEDREKFHYSLKGE